MEGFARALRRVLLGWEPKTLLGGFSVDPEPRGLEAMVWEARLGTPPGPRALTGIGGDGPGPLTKCALPWVVALGYGMVRS
jgi:hypothetical protein